ncbi:N-acetylglucosamine kinase [Undibacterium pigrum]|uniref:N-acetylglucosamine kinase-like BadF-type ATPase n=1 Tax=Undibacterium pigrum TaxID=401470 RepID=A0A318J5J3_9BURK|nr:BadF/BadG/BcrA/BcrD ATPase family protein [Undibacterium pigrum]PXX43109.1 N-acetylglucosamine kinase-like BadF-type ATPase [Undibacterium pigrum]
MPSDQQISAQQSTAIALGIDAGGTQTRWALASRDEQILASGTAAGLTALQTDTHEGIQALEQVFAGLAAATSSHGQVGSIRAGITGFGGDAHTLPHMLADCFGLQHAHVSVSNDIEIAYLDIFKPGTGYLIYAGTGSIAAYIDGNGEFHRAGGRGYLLDDAGGGFWIAREAMRQLWRAEDEHPDHWKESEMAKRLFKLIGGNDWNISRDFIYHRSRGDIGKLALAVAASANSDPVAMSILKNAGKELARLGTAMCTRFGNKPIALSGRVQELHPAIIESLRLHLPPEISLRQSTCEAHFSAARLAARHLKKQS